MTIYRGTLEGGPAGDPGLAAFAEVLRTAYAVAFLDLEEVLGRPTTDVDEVDHFAAFLAGHRPPIVNVDTKGRL